MPLDIAIQHEDEVDWSVVSDCPDITWGIVKANPNAPWDWTSLSGNPNVATPAIVTANPKMPWNWNDLSINPNMTPEFVQKNIKKPWNWTALSMNPGMTAEFILKHKKKPWNWGYVAHNEFTNNSVLKKRRVLRILRKWRSIAISRADQRKQLYDPVMDVLRMRIRDVEKGVTKSLLTAPKRLL